MTAAPPSGSDSDCYSSGRVAGTDTLDATPSAPAPDNVPRQPSPPPSRLLEFAHFEESSRNPNHTTRSTPPRCLSPSCSPVTKENTSPVMFDEMHGDVEETLDEVEEDDAPLPPETIAASFEAVKLELIDEVDSPVPGEQIAASFEGCGDEEEKWEDEEEDAPLPPETIASSFEAIAPADPEAKKKPPGLIGDDSGAPGPGAQMIEEHEVEEYISGTQDMINSLMQVIDEVFGNDETLGTENQERLLDHSSSLNEQLFATTNAQVDAFSIAPTPQGGDDSSVPVSGQGHVEIRIDHTPELLSPPRPNLYSSGQSVPLLEATLVQDIPIEPIYIYVANEGPVYDAVPMSATQDSNAHYWSRISRKPGIIALGLILVATISALVVGVVVVGNRNSNLVVNQSKTPSSDPSENPIGIQSVSENCMIVVN